MIVPSDAQFPKMADGRTTLGTTFVSIRVHSWFNNPLLYFRVVRVFRGSEPHWPRHSCPLVAISGSITLCSIFVCFVCFVVLNHPEYAIRVHSWFNNPLLSFRVFRVFRGSESPWPRHSCPLVSIRVHSWFNNPLLYFRVFCAFRGSESPWLRYSCPFVSIRGSITLCSIFVSCVSWF